MSALEIIEQIKELPAEEQQVVVKFVKDIQIPADSAPRAEPDWNKIIHKVLADRADLFHRLAQ